MWVKKQPVYGDQIRVNRGFYYHHGIYAEDNRIYQFAVPDGGDIDPENARICITTLDKFLKGGVLEVREYTPMELAKKRTPDEIIEYAKAHLGEAGYDLLTNNCEHFSNRCAFEEAQQTQIDDIFGTIFEAISTISIDNRKYSDTIDTEIVELKPEDK